MATTDAAALAQGLVRDLDLLPWDLRTTTQLPADPEPGNELRQVEAAAFSRVAPTPVADPKVLLWVPEVAELLGLDPALADDPDAAQVFGGNRVPAGADPFAACYGGHQFGGWAGQLGDGRAIALGEVRDVLGGHQVLQLKGAGPTPYSRRADGRAVLRSSLRELLCSEAVHHLGIPTTRALCLVGTGDQVVRDVLYDGNPAPEPGAVVCRVAPSFVRFGTFELPASRGDLDLLSQLVEHTVRNEYPHLLEAGPSASSSEVVAALFDEVVERTAALVVDWMRVGFVHGVMNTDNLSVLGLTIDYGPYGWLEPFDPGWTPNTTDAGSRRYRYGAQPHIAQWDLLQLAQALVQLTGDPQPLQASLERFASSYKARYSAMLAERLGWGAPQEADDALGRRLFEVLMATEVDQALFFRDLAGVPLDGDDDALLAPLAEAFYAPDKVIGEVRAGLVGWLRDWGRRVVEGGVRDDAERRRRMDAVNPRFVLRNWLAQEAIEAAEQGDLSVATHLLDVLRRPYDEQPGEERLATRRPEWARVKVGCSMLSCSS